MSAITGVKRQIEDPIDREAKDFCSESRREVKRAGSFQWAATLGTIMQAKNAVSIDITIAKAQCLLDSIQYNLNALVTMSMENKVHVFRLLPNEDLSFSHALRVSDDPVLQSLGISIHNQLYAQKHEIISSILNSISVGCTFRVLP